MNLKLPGTPDRALLEDLYRAAVAAVDPGPAVSSALRQRGHLDAARGRKLWILSLGKAALPMATSAAQVATEAGIPIAGGLVVPPAPGASPDPSLTVIPGDHPEPGAGSLAASAQLGQVAGRVAAGDHVWVLLSGGTTSLIGAPMPGISPEDLSVLYRLLLASGLDITAMNQIRKRFTRWGGGKLAAALRGAIVHQFVVSDVIGDDLPSIGSGPCIPDPATATQVHQVLEAHGLWARLPSSLQQLVVDTESGTNAETPKPNDPAFASVQTEVVSSNRLALDAAAVRAAALGLVTSVVPRPLEGEAGPAGTSVAATLRNYSQAHGTQGAARRCVILGGETTVTLGAVHGLGGRSQELALAAARELSGLERVSMLAAGTDGRDGPTDAAGAIVDGTTWNQMIVAGRNPAADLERHDAYPALNSVQALFQPGLTGTNVMDLVIGIA